MIYKIKIDDAGRIIIPKKIRIKYQIEKNKEILLTTKEQGFSLKPKPKYINKESIINKIKYLEKKYKKELFITEKEIVIYPNNISIKNLDQYSKIEINKTTNLYIKEQDKEILEVIKILLSK